MFTSHVRDIVTVVSMPSSSLAAEIEDAVNADPTIRSVLPVATVAMPEVPAMAASTVGAIGATAAALFVNVIVTTALAPALTLVLTVRTNTPPDCVQPAVDPV